MTTQEFALILRTRWKIVCATFVIIVLGALAYSLLTTPQYQASTRLFLSTSGADASLVKDGSDFAQRRVISYTMLLEGEALAQRTIARLNLDMSAAQLQEAVLATSPVDTVLIDVTVSDTSPTRARDIVNTLSDEFVLMAANLESPAGGAPSPEQVVVQQRARTPEFPATPKKRRNLLIAAALGALAGVIIAITRDRLDRSVRNSAVAEQATGIGVIGEIPFQRQLSLQPLISFTDNHSEVAEAFRELRINLQHLEIADGPRVVTVASARGGEGRTTTAINLALALAAAKHKVIVVDGNLRRPQVASYLGINEQVGLSTVLTGDAALSQALKETRFLRLTALTAGAAPANPTELLGSEAAKDVLNELGRNFDYVIVDSPPTLVKDAAILAGNSQGVLMIGRFGKTTCNDLERSARDLRRAGANPIGIALTMTPANKRSSLEKGYYAGSQENSRLQGGRERRSANNR